MVQEVLHRLHKKGGVMSVRVLSEVKQRASFDIEPVLWMFVGMVSPHIEHQPESYRLAMFLTGRNSIPPLSERIILSDARKRIHELCETNESLKIIRDRLDPFPQKEDEAANQSFVVGWMKRQLARFAREVPIVIEKT